MFVCFCHTLQCLGVTSGSALQELLMEDSGDHVGCWGSNLGLCARQESYPPFNCPDEPCSYRFLPCPDPGQGAAICFRFRAGLMVPSGRWNMGRAWLAWGQGQEGGTGHCGRLPPSCCLAPGAFPGDRPHVGKEDTRVPASLLWGAGCWHKSSYAASALTPGPSGAPHLSGHT